MKNRIKKPSQPSAAHTQEQPITMQEIVQEIVQERTNAQGQAELVEKAVQAGAKTILAVLRGD